MHLTHCKWTALILKFAFETDYPRKSSFNFVPSTRYPATERHSILIHFRERQIEFLTVVIFVKYVDVV